MSEEKKEQSWFSKPGLESSEYKLSRGALVMNALVALISLAACFVAEDWKPMLINVVSILNSLGATNYANGRANLKTAAAVADANPSAPSAS